MPAAASGPMLSGLLDGFTERWQLSGGVADETDVIDALTTFLYRALNGRDA